MVDEDELCRRTAAAIAEGKVVGWFQGRMEWGPRALGNRSILCDPRRADMKDILNAKIKRRESFRPFAPSILDEQVADWFEEDDDVPFMMQVFQIREEKRPLIPAVTHVDGSGRLQTVSARTNPRYYRLIEASATYRRADGAQHLVQRERAGGLHAAGSARLLPAHQDGRAGDGRDHDPPSHIAAKAKTHAATFPSYAGQRPRRLSAAGRLSVDRRALHLGQRTHQSGVACKAYRAGFVVR